MLRLNEQFVAGLKELPTDDEECTYGGMLLAPPLPTLAAIPLSPAAAAASDGRSIPELRRIRFIELMLGILREIKWIIYMCTSRHDTCVERQSYSFSHHKFSPLCMYVACLHACTDE